MASNLHYSRELLLALAESPLVQRPEDLPPIESYYTKPEPVQRGGDGERPPRVVREKTDPGDNNPNDINPPRRIDRVLGPPRMNFASAQNGGNPSATGENGTARPQKNYRQPPATNSDDTTKKPPAVATGASAFPRAPKYNLEERIRTSPSSATAGTPRSKADRENDTERPARTPTDKPSTRSSQQQPQAPPSNSNDSAVPPRDLSALRTNKRSDEALRGKTDAAKIGATRTNASNRPTNDRLMAGGGGPTTNSNTATTTNNRRTGQPEWMSFETPKTDGANDAAKLTPAPVGPKGPGAIGFQGVDEIQKFKAMMKEQERQSAGGAALNAGMGGAIGEGRPVEPIGASKPTPPQNNVDSLFAEGGFVLKDSLFGGKGFFDSNISSTTGGSRIPALRDLMGPEPSNESLFNSAVESSTISPTNATGRVVSRFQQLFKEDPSPEMLSAGLPSEAQQGPRFQNWMDLNSNSKQDNLNSLLQGLTGASPQHGRPAEGPSEKDFISPKPMSEEEIIQQLMANKNKNPNANANNANNMGPPHIPHGPSAGPARPGRAGSEEEMMKNQIMQQLMGGGGINLGGAGGRPPMNPQGRENNQRLGPGGGGGGQIMTEEDILRMQGIGMGPQVNDPKGRGNGAGRQGVAAKGMSEEEVLQTLGAPARPRPEGQRDGGSPPIGGQEKEFERVMAMLSRSGINGGNDGNNVGNMPRLPPHAMRPPAGGMPMQNFGGPMPGGPGMPPHMPPHQLQQMHNMQGPPGPGMGQGMGPPLNMQQMQMMAMMGGMPMPPMNNPSFGPGNPPPGHYMRPPPPPMQGYRPGMPSSSDDQLAAMLQSSINAKKGGPGGPLSGPRPVNNEGGMLKVLAEGMGPGQPDMQKGPMPRPPMPPGGMMYGRPMDDAMNPPFGGFGNMPPPPYMMMGPRPMGPQYGGFPPHMMGQMPPPPLSSKPADSPN
ncbi:hypothetical protein HDV05_008091 [Chytridiales sp. JEL 0842]|nr:hypothetical protein HDV05_008091 [Chytridiales sp. JEL 0842]